MKLMKRLVSILAATLLAWSVCLAQNGAISTVAQKYSEGDFATAFKLAIALATQEPDNDAAWYYAAMARMALEQKGYIFKGDGVEYMKKAIQLDSTNYWYRDRLAVFYLMRGENELATAEYEKLARDFPRKTDAYYQLVNLYLREGDNAKALDMLDEIDALAGKTDPSVMTRYRILLQQQKQEDALTVLKAYSEEYASPQVLSMLGEHEMGMFNDSLALAYYDEALALDKDFAPAQLGKAEALRMTRRYPEFFRALHSLMDNETAQGAAKADYMVQLMQHSDPHFLRTFTPQLDTVWNTAVARHPLDSAVVSGAGIWYYQTGRQDKSLELFGNYAEANPDDVGATVTKLQLLTSLGRYEEVIAEAEKAYARFPREVRLLEFVSSASSNLKDYEAMIRVCDRMLAAAPKDSAICIAAHTIKGDAYHKLGKDGECYKSYKKALKINPSYAPVLNNYAYYLALSGKMLGQAAKMSRKAVEQEPDNATYLDTLGWILHLQGKDAEAKPLFKHAMLYGGKDSAVILSHYARVLEVLGETDLAKVYRTQAQNKASSDEEE